MTVDEKFDRHWKEIIAKATELSILPLVDNPISKAQAQASFFEGYKLGMEVTINGEG